MSGSPALKRRLAIAGFACLAGVASAPLAVMSFGGGSDLSLPGVQTAERLMAMLDARSPGERAAGALTQSKLRLAAAPRATTPVKPQPSNPPMEELARVIVPAPPVPTLPVEVLPPLVPPAAADVIAPSTLLASAPGGFGSEVIGGGGFGLGPGGSAPPGGNAPPTGEAPAPPPVTSAVPEPGTWVTMLLGFAMIGSAMPRRCRRRAHCAAEA